MFLLVRSEKGTVEPAFSKLFERRKNVYYCQVFTIYHVIYAMIANLGKKKKSLLIPEVYFLLVFYCRIQL